MRKLCVPAQVMRICADYAHMRILCVYAHIMRRCANDAYMRRVCVYAHITRICAIRQRQENVADSSRKRPRGPGAVHLGWISPLPLLSRFSLYFKATGNTYIYLPTRSPRRPEGAADFPCLRQLPPPPEKNAKTKGSKKVMEKRKNIPHRRKAR